jgi:uncharacterized protein YjbI with pentapeptide repeats
MANKKHLAILKQGVEAWNAWRKQNPKDIPDLSEANLSRADLRGADLSGAKLHGTKFMNVNLSQAKLLQANLSGANLRRATLGKADLRGADLSRSNLVEAYLYEAILAEAYLYEANLNRANLFKAVLFQANLFGATLNRAILSRADIGGANLSTAELSGAILTAANLSDADLTFANLSKAKLSGANLSATKALGTHFRGAILTGACIADWNTNNETSLDDVFCKYVYRKFDLNKNQKAERRPPGRNYEPGEFKKVFQKVQDTIELIFSNGVNWDAFACAYKRLRIENEDLDLDIKTIDNRDGVLVVTVQGIPRAYQTKWEKDFWQRYELAVQALETKYQSELRAKDGQIVLYERMINQSERTITRHEKIIDQQAGEINQLIERLDNPVLRDINIHTSQNSSVTTNPKNKSFMSENYQNKYYQPNANIGSIVDTAQDNARVQSILHNYAPEQKQTLAEAATEIQNLLKQLQSDGFSLDDAQKQVASDLVNRAQNNPTFKSKLERWARYLGDAAANGLIGEAVVTVLKSVLQSQGIPLP